MKDVKRSVSTKSIRRLFLALICSIFVGEMLVMLVLDALPPLSPWGEALLDSSLLSIPVFPILYFFVFRPMTIHIAERKLAEEELRESEERFRTSIDNMLDCFGIYSAIRDESGRIIDFQIEYVNEAACRSNRMSREQQLGQRLCELLPAHRETGLFDEYCQVENTGVPLVKESLSYEDRYGTRVLSRAFDIRATKLGDGFAVAWRDVTDRKRAEENLEKEFRMRTALLDSIPGCIALILKKGTREIVASNRFARELGAVPGQTCFKICAMRDDNCPFCLAPRLWATGQLQRLEVEYRGTWYEGIWVPLSESLYVHYIFDIVQRKQAEEAIRTSRRELLALSSELASAEDRERRQLAEDLHDRVGQSLGALSLHLQVLRGAELSGEQAAALTESLALVKQTAHEARALSFELCPPMLYEMGLAPALSWLVEQREQEHPAEFRFEDDEQAAPLSDEAAGAVFRAVRELLRNAARHANPSHVKVSVGREGNLLRVCVEDDGIGFDPVGVGGGGREGAGFGLFSIHERARHLGGRFEIESSPGRGSRFTLLVPIEVDKGEASSATGTADGLGDLCG